MTLIFPVHRTTNALFRQWLTCEGVLRGKKQDLGVDFSRYLHDIGLSKGEGVFLLWSCNLLKI